MTVPDAKDVAPWVEKLARVGYAAKALLYITVGLLAAQAGLGQGRRALDTQDALRAVHHVTFGRVALIVVAAGLIGYAVWRVVEGVMDPDRRGTDAKGLALRSSFAARGLFHGALGISTLRLAARARPGPRSDSVRHWTSVAFSLPAGDMLVWGTALGVGGYGLYQLYRAYASKLSSQLKLGQLGTGTRQWVIAVSRFGIAARGVVFCLIGFFLAQAALQHDAAEARGLGGSLRTLAHAGRWPFIVVALGLAAYGVYQLVNARYRRIRVV